jgi:hypothetical protein
MGKYNGLFLTIGKAENFCRSLLGHLGDFLFTGKIQNGSLSVAVILKIPFLSRIINDSILEISLRIHVG